MARGKRGRKAGRLICEHCNLAGVSYGDFCPCPLCRKVLCVYHRKPERHACEAVDWEALEAKRSKEPGSQELLSAGNILKALILIISGFFLFKAAEAAWSWASDKASRLWRFSRAQALVLATVPLAIFFLAGIFPDSAAVLGLDKSHFDRMLDVKLELPHGIALGGAAQEESPALPMLAGLRGCSMAMRYSSTLEHQPGGKCSTLCSDRGYASYAILKDAGSYDCYCCPGTGNQSG